MKKIILIVFVLLMNGCSLNSVSKDKLIYEKEIENVQLKFYMGENQHIYFTDGENKYGDNEKEQYLLVEDGNFAIACDSKTSYTIYYNDEEILAVDTFEWQSNEETNKASIYVLNTQVEYEWEIVTK